MFIFSELLYLCRELGVFFFFSFFFFFFLFFLKILNIFNTHTGRWKNVLKKLTVVYIKKSLTLRYTAHLELGL